MLGDRRVDHPARPELVEQALADLVGALILGDLLAHQKHIRIRAHFHRHRIPERLTHGDGLGRPPVALGLGRRRRGRDGQGRHRLRLGLRRGLGHGRCTRGRRGRGGGGGTLAAADLGDRRVDGDTFGAFLDKDGGELALIHRLDLHGRLIGLDLGDDVAGLDLLADLLEPAGELALGHRRTEGRHQDLRRHGAQASTRMSVQSSFGSGSGLDCAKSAASWTTAFTASSIFLISASSTPSSVSRW